MGADKAFTEVGGRWLIACALSALAEASQRIVVGGRDRRLAQAAAAAGAQQVSDRWPGEGPLGALATALGSARHPVTVILPCDLPAIGAEDVMALVRAVCQAPAGPAPSAAVFTDQRRHHLPLAIETRAVAAAEGLFSSGQRSVASLLDETAVVDVPAPPDAVTDIDCPEDLWSIRPTNLARVEIPEISVAELAELIGADIALIDVREPDEHAEARVPGAVLIPLGAIPERLADLPDRHLYMICAMGGRSLKAAEYLIARGWACTNVAGGTNGWVEAGYPHDSGPVVD